MTDSKNGLKPIMPPVAFIGTFCTYLNEIRVGVRPPEQLIYKVTPETFRKIQSYITIGDKRYSKRAFVSSIYSTWHRTNRVNATCSIDYGDEMITYIITMNLTKQRTWKVCFLSTAYEEAQKHRMEILMDDGEMFF